MDKYPTDNFSKIKVFTSLLVYYLYLIVFGMKIKTVVYSDEKINH